MKVGVIGLGWMGKLHMRVYSEMRGVEVIGAMDVDQGSLSEVNEKYGVKTFADLDDFLAQDYDAVSVCVPTSLHFETGMKLVERGIPMLMEKPITATAEQGRKLVAAAGEKNVPVMVGHIERFNPAVGRVRDLVQEDEHVISIMIERVGPYPPRIQDVGVVRDLASHDIDLTCHISGGKYNKIHGVTSTNIGEHEDTVIINAEMDNGVLGQINCNWVTPYKSRNIRVATNSRYIEANLITQQVKEYSRFERYDASFSVREWPVMYREPVKEELTSYLSAVKNGDPMPIPAEDGLYVIETIEKLEADGMMCK